jgi:hypothetical protein
MQLQGGGDAGGMSTGCAAVFGAVIMKVTSSTRRTPTSGVVLISALKV